MFFLFLPTLEDLLLTLVLLLQPIPTCPCLEKDKAINLHFSVLMSLYSHSLLLHMLLDMLDRPSTKSNNSGASYFSYYLFPPFLRHQNITNNCTGFSHLYWLYYLKREKILWSFLPPSQGSPRHPLKYFLFLEKSNVFSIIPIRITEQWDTCLFFLVAVKTCSLSYCTFREEFYYNWCIVWSLSRLLPELLLSIDIYIFLKAFIIMDNRCD